MEGEDSKPTLLCVKRSARRCAHLEYSVNNCPPVQVTVDVTCGRHNAWICWRPTWQPRWISTPWPEELQAIG